MPKQFRIDIHEFYKAYYLDGKEVTIHQYYEAYDQMYADVQAALVEKFILDTNAVLSH